MTDAPTRAPSVAEAVAFLCMPASKSYRLRCIAHWRDLVGQSFADKVESEFRKRRRDKRADQ